MAEHHIPALDKVIKDFGKQMAEITNRRVFVTVPRNGHLYAFRGPVDQLCAWLAALDKLAP